MYSLLLKWWDCLNGTCVVNCTLSILFFRVTIFAITRVQGRSATVSVGFGVPR